MRLIFWIQLFPAISPFYKPEVQNYLFDTHQTHYNSLDYCQAGM